MAKINQFGGAQSGLTGGTHDCLPFEAMLADAIDGTLSATEKARFDAHLLTCSQCPGMLADAQRGQALLEMLRPEVLEPNPTLLDRIFAKTSVLSAQQEEAARAERRAASDAASLLGRPLTARPLMAVPLGTALEGVPAGLGSGLGSELGSGLGSGLASGPGSGLGANVLPFREQLQNRLRVARHTIFQPRFAMTAAMAFFSIALTLNLSGVRLSEMRASDLKPGNVKRGVYEARARVVRYYANLRVVYELESRVHDLQRSGDEDAASGRSPQAAPQAKPETKPEAQDPGTAPDGKGGTASPAPAAPGAGSDKTGTPEDRKRLKPKPNSGTSRCIWPLPPLQEVRLQTSPRNSFRRPLVTVQLQSIFEPQGKRGLA